jgi:hypothetical protein
VLKAFLICRLADATVAYLVLQCGSGLELVMHVSNTITDRTRDGLFDSLFLLHSASTAHIYALACVCISLFQNVADWLLLEM